MGTGQGVNGWEDGLSSGGGYDRYGGPELPATWRVLIDADLAHRDYEFSSVCVWQAAPFGLLYAAADSGCSCPTPYSDLTAAGCKEIKKVADLDPLIAYAEDKPWSDDPDYDTERFQQIAVSKADLIAKVHRALRDSTGGARWDGYTEG